MAGDLVALIKAKQTMIAQLQSELNEALSLLRSGSAAAVLEEGKHTPHRQGRSRKPRKRIRKDLPYQEGSSIALAVKVLADHGKPLHVDDLVAGIEKLGHKVKRTTLVSNIARYVKKQVLFYRDGPNTFGLSEWKK